MAYQLRERYPTTLEEVQANALKVEANLLAKKAKLKTERRVTIKEEHSPSSSSNYKIDNLLKTIERMIERISIIDRAPRRENQPTPQIKNLNFRINPPQIKQREQKGLDQQILHFKRTIQIRRENKLKT